MLSRLPLLHPALSLRLPGVPNTGHLKPVEDQIDAVLCAYIAAHWWYWAIYYAKRNTLISTEAAGRTPLDSCRAVDRDMQSLPVAGFHFGVVPPWFVVVAWSRSSICRASVPRCKPCNAEA